MSSHRKPIYVSQGSVRSFGQSYRIYEGRVELECRIFLRTLILPMDEVLEMQTAPAGVFAPFREAWQGKCTWASTLWVSVIDLAAFHRHVILHKRRGLVRYIRFAPIDPEGFVKAWRSLC